VLFSASIQKSRQALVKKWDYLLGPADDFLLEYRIFHTFILITIIIFILDMVMYLGVGQYPGAVTTLGMIFYEMGLLYVSRFKRYTQACIIVDAILFNFILAFTFFTDNGLDGPCILMLFVAFVGLSTYAPRKYAALLLSTNVLTVIALQTLAYQFPDFTLSVQQSLLGRHITIFYTYCTSAILIFWSVSLLRKSYYQENDLAKREAEQLALANAEKNKLFSVIAHDLRSPLTQINQYLQLLSQVKLDEDTRQSLELKLADSTKNTQLLLTNLLTWSVSQFSTNQSQVNLKPVNLLNAMQQAEQPLHHAAMLKQVEVKITIAPTLYIEADENYLQIILRNLLHNAIKFTPQGGLVTLTANEDANDNQCLISIQDNGIGISDEQQKFIFTMQSGSTYGTNMEKGIGLGLALAKEYTLLQHGNIWLNSTPNLGSTFYLQFKLAIS
jgi:two-component system, sensor histidine kinase and response regulator